MGASRQPPNGGVDLSRSGRVALTSMDVWPAASVELLPGGIAGLSGETTMRFINTVTGQCVLIPFQQQNARKVIAQFDDAVSAVDIAQSGTEQP